MFLRILYSILTKLQENLWIKLYVWNKVNVASMFLNCNYICRVRYTLCSNLLFTVLYQAPGHLDHSCSVSSLLLRLSSGWQTFSFQDYSSYQKSPHILKTHPLWTFITRCSKDNPINGKHLICLIFYTAKYFYLLVIYFIHLFIPSGPVGWQSLVYRQYFEIQCLVILPEHTP